MFNTLLRWLGIGFVNEPSQLGHIPAAMNHPGERRQAIPASPPCLLVVGLQTFGQVQMGDEAYVRFVYAHAEGDGGHHHHATLAAKAIEG